MQKINFLSLLNFLGKRLARNERGFIVTSLSEVFALVYHICFLVFFNVFGITQMFYFNIFSVSCFSVCIFILFKFKNETLVFFITLFEVIIHQIMADYFLGSLAGFHFLIIILVIYPYLIEKRNFHVGIPISFICLLVFFACEIVFSRTDPVYVLEDSVLKTVRAVNIIATMVVVLTMILIFKLIINYIENSLEELNQKNEELLENILPRKLVEILREKGSTEPEMFNNVTVLFTDIVNFTRISKDLSPEILINELNDIFTNFDRIMDKHNCVRIKTIGDAYLAVCGLPVEDEAHTENLVLAALECRDYLQERNRTAEHKWTIRLGIHTGTVVAGIVGIKKYIYDVFGDTVNVASRMETSSQEMKLCATEDVCSKLGDSFAYTDLGEKEIKGKGRMKLFLVENSAIIS